MILAAGVGSRLSPLTDELPKALLEFRGKTMLEHVIGSLRDAGIGEVIINLHHHADKIEHFVVDHKNFGLKIAFSNERDLLMDTGGGIMKASWFLDDRPFLVHNVDILTDLDLMALYDFHLREGPLATLAVTARPTSRNLLVNGQGLLCGWRNNQTGEEIIARDDRELRPVAFSGVHVLDPEIFSLMEPHKPFSITKAYLDLAGRYEIMTMDHSGGTWTDMARPENFGLE